MSNVTGPSRPSDFESLPKEIQTQFKNAHQEINQELSKTGGSPDTTAAKLFSQIFSDIRQKRFQDRSFELQDLDVQGITKKQLAQILRPGSEVPAFSTDQINEIVEDVYQNYTFPLRVRTEVPQATIKEDSESVITQLKLTIKKLENDYASLKGRGSILSEEQQQRIKSLQVQIDQFLHYDFPELAQQKEKGDETIHKLRSAVQEMQKTISGFSEQIEKAQNEKEQYLNSFLKLQAAQKELDKQIQNKDETIQQFRTTIAALKKDYTTLQQQKKLTDEQGENLLNKINDLTKKCDTLEKQATLNAQDISAFKNDADGLLALINFLKMKVIDLTKANTKLWVENFKLQQENRDLSFKNTQFKIMFLIQIVIVGLFFLFSAIEPPKRTFFPS